MCGSALRADRSSLASASLAKAREAVLLVARMRPRTARVFRMVCRNDQYWYPTSAADVRNSTSPLMSTSITVSFRLIGQSRSGMSAPGWRDDLGHAQQLGADRETCRLCRVEVDLQPDAVVVGHEANHASPFREAVVIAHGENRLAPHARENVVESSGTGPADEQDVTGLDLVHAVIALDLEGAPPYLLAAYGLIEKALERVVPQNADDERGAGVGKGGRRPTDELREVEQENRLHLRLGGPGRVRPQAGGRGHQHGGADVRRAQKRHATAPYTPRLISRRPPGGLGEPNSASSSCRRICPTADSRSRGTGCHPT